MEETGVKRVEKIQRQIKRMRLTYVNLCRSRWKFTIGGNLFLKYQMNVAKCNSLMTCLFNIDRKMYYVTSIPQILWHAWLIIVTNLNELLHWQVNIYICRQTINQKKQVKIRSCQRSIWFQTSRLLWMEDCHPSCHPSLEQVFSIAQTNLKFYCHNNGKFCGNTENISAVQFSN